MNHLCTSQSLLAGAIEGESICLICREKTQHEMGYILCKCGSCDSVYVYDDYGQICRMRREYLGLSRQEIADLYGVKKSTITQYEKWPSQKYWHWILELKNTLQGVTEE